MTERNSREHTTANFTSVPIYARKKRTVTTLKLSPSKIAVFHQCRQRYKFLYLDKLGEQYGRAKPFFTMANHIHATLKDFFTLVPAELRTAETIARLLQKNWRRYQVGFRDAQDAMRWHDRAMEQLSSFVQNHDVTINPLMMERSFEVGITPGIILRGRVDRIDRQPDGTLHIIDYKTGHMPSEIDWAQVQLHALAASQHLGSPVTRVSYLYLRPSTLESIPLSPDDIDQVRWELLRAARKIRREKRFSPMTGPWCGNCDFKPICPGAPEVVPCDQLEGQLELWDDLPDDL
jgi:RecB family exonuclease